MGVATKNFLKYEALLRKELGKGKVGLSSRVGEERKRQELRRQARRPAERSGHKPQAVRLAGIDCCPFAHQRYVPLGCAGCFSPLVISSRDYFMTKRFLKMVRSYWSFVHAACILRSSPDAASYLLKTFTIRVLHTRARCELFHSDLPLS